MATTNKHGSTFGGSVDISSRQRGAQAALKDLGVSGAVPQMKNLGKTPLGAKPEKPPALKTLPAHSYTTSGTLVNPKVASLEDAPNYVPATSPSINCERCAAYTKEDSVMGSCAKYDFFANAAYSCDSWKPKLGKAPKQF